MKLLKVKHRVCDSGGTEFETEIALNPHQISTIEPNDVFTSFVGINGRHLLVTHNYVGFLETVERYTKTNDSKIQTHKIK